jgi:hypothetical protein
LIDHVEQFQAEMDMLEAGLIKKGERASREELEKRQLEFFFLPDGELDGFVGVHGMAWRQNFRRRVEKGEEVETSYWMDWCGKWRGSTIQRHDGGFVQERVLI